MKIRGSNIRTELETKELTIEHHGIVLHIHNLERGLDIEPEIFCQLVATNEKETPLRIKPYGINCVMNPKQIEDIKKWNCLDTVLKGYQTQYKMISVIDKDSEESIGLENNPNIKNIRDNGDLNNLNDLKETLNIEIKQNEKFKEIIRKSFNEVSKNRLTKDERDWLIISIGILQSTFLDNDKAKQCAETVKNKLIRYDF